MDSDPLGLSQPASPPCSLEDDDPGAVSPVSDSLSLPVANKRCIVWKDGVPIPATSPLLTKPQMEALPAAAASLLFIDPLDLEPEFHGMTNAEVAYIKRARKAAAGDDHSLDKMEDRILGKSKQTSEIKSLHLSYEDFLKEVARQENPAAPDAYDGETVEDPLGDMAQ